MAIKNLVDVSSYGVWETHLAHLGFGYATVCGLDGNDPSLGQDSRPATKNHIDCEQCKMIIEVCKGASRYIKKSSK